MARGQRWRLAVELIHRYRVRILLGWPLTSIEVLKTDKSTGGSTLSCVTSMCAHRFYYVHFIHKGFLLCPLLDLRRKCAYFMLHVNCSKLSIACSGRIPQATQVRGMCVLNVELKSNLWYTGLIGSYSIRPASRETGHGDSTHTTQLQTSPEWFVSNHVLLSDMQ